MSQKLALLENASATGSGFAWPGGKGMFTAKGSNFGTVKLQVMIDDGSTGTWVDVTSASLSANGYAAFELPPCSIRANVASATAVYAYAVSQGRV